MAGQGTYYVDDDAVEHWQRIFGIAVTEVRQPHYVRKDMPVEVSPCEECWRSSYCSAGCKRYRVYLQKGSFPKLEAGRHTLALLMRN